MSEREAWDAYAAAAFQQLKDPYVMRQAERAAEYADALLAERRKRWPAETSGTSGSREAETTVSNSTPAGVPADAGFLLSRLAETEARLSSAMGYIDAAKIAAERHGRICGEPLNEWIEKAMGQVEPGDAEKDHPPSTGGDAGVMASGPLPADAGPARAPRHGPEWVCKDETCPRCEPASTEHLTHEAAHAAGEEGARWAKERRDAEALAERLYAENAPSPDAPVPLKPPAPEPSAPRPMDPDVVQVPRAELDGMFSHVRAEGYAAGLENGIAHGLKWAAEECAGIADMHDLPCTRCIERIRDLAKREVGR